MIESRCEEGWKLILSMKQSFLCFCSWSIFKFMMLVMLADAQWRHAVTSTHPLTLSCLFAEMKLSHVIIAIHVTSQALSRRFSYEKQTCSLNGRFASMQDSWEIVRRSQASFGNYDIVDVSNDAKKYRSCFDIRPLYFSFKTTWSWLKMSALYVVDWFYRRMSMNPYPQFSRGLCVFFLSDSYAVLV